MSNIFNKHVSNYDEMNEVKDYDEKIFKNDNVFIDKTNHFNENEASMNKCVDRIDKDIFTFKNNKIYDDFSNKNEKICFK